MRQLLIESIRIDGGTQSRGSISDETVAEYVEAVNAGAKMPPVVVFFDGSDYWLAEGFHRFLACQRAEKRHVLAEVKNGTKEDAAWESAGANVTHGLRRTREDKRCATKLALKLRPDLTDEALAQHCGVSREFVNRMRQEVVTKSQPEHNSTHRVGVDGKRYPAPPQRSPDKPPASPPPSRPTAPVPPLPTPSVKPTVAQDTPAPVRRPGPQTGQVDETGRLIPDHLIPLWERRDEVEDVLALISKARVTVDSAQKASDPLWAELNASSAMANLNATYDMIKGTKPHAVCPWCHGNLSDQCRACKGRGMIGSFAWGRVPAELKQGRK